MLKSRFDFLHHLAWKLLILSLVITAGIAYLLRGKFYPYEFKEIESIPNTDIFRTYHDFDQDGFSEYLENRVNPGRYYTQVRNWSGGIIDQTNYGEYYLPDWMMFADITGDGYDEIINFSRAGDSLYFYAHDIVSKKAIINRLFLARIEEPLSPNEPAAYFLPGGIADREVYNGKVVIFAIRSFTSLRPRTVYALDLDKRQIIRRFETLAALSNLFLYDINGDGTDEIIVSGVAYGNVHHAAKYRDDKCWLFVLDQKLNPLFPPLSFSEYPSELACLPVEIYTGRYLLVIPDYLGEKNLARMMYLIDSQGIIHSRTPNPFHESLEYYSPVTSHNKNPFELFGWQGKNVLLKLNHRFEAVKKVSTPFEFIRPLLLKDLDADGNEELLCVSERYFSVFDSELNLLARFTITSREVKISFRESGPRQPLEICLRVGTDFYRLDLSKNQLYSLFPLIFAVFVIIVFLVLTGAHKFLTIGSIYFHFFRHNLYDTSEGIIIVNSQGKILHTNHQVHQILDMPHAPQKGENIFNVLNNFPQIIEFIQTSVENSRSLQGTFDLREPYPPREVETDIEPFRFLTKSGFSYLIKLKTAVPSSTSDKIQTWSRAVQKMAHDIKTPLSTISLNLKALKMRLEKIALPENDYREISDDIQMMRTELENIQAMTRNFLKFSNLEKPHFQAFDIKSIVEEAVCKYRPYLSDEQDIQILIEEDVKPVWADPWQIEMVFHVLLENALSALQGKGLISITVSLAQFLDKSFLEFLEIEVADTGPGISEENKSKIFEPYFTTRPKGSGMGLAIAKKIIEDHGGFIEVHSKAHFGAVFCFALPVIRNEEKNG